MDFALHLSSTLVCQGTEAIKGILFDLSIPKRKRMDITTKSFEMMTRLRLLKIYWARKSTSMREDNKVVQRL